MDCPCTCTLSYTTLYTVYMDYTRHDQLVTPTHNTLKGISYNAREVIRCVETNPNALATTL
jgi:D-ribose pyranose/furanose isomerase RbsD